MKPLIIERPYLLLSLSSRSCARLSAPRFRHVSVFSAPLSRSPPLPLGPLPPRPPSRRAGAPIVIIYLWEVKRTLNATTGMFPIIQHPAFPFVPIDVALEHCILGAHSYTVIPVSKDRQDVLMSARSVCEQGEERVFLLVGKGIETKCDAEAVRLKINLAALCSTITSSANSFENGTRSVSTLVLTSSFPDAPLSKSMTPPRIRPSAQ